MRCLGCPVGTRQSRDSRPHLKSGVLEDMTSRLVAAIAVALSVLGASCCSFAPSDPAGVIDVRLTEVAVLAGVAGTLPDSVEFHDQMGRVQVARLDRALDVTGIASVSEFHRGDVAYSSSEQSLVVFQTDDHAAGELTVLGDVAEGLEWLSSCVRDCKAAVRIVDGGKE